MMATKHLQNWQPSAMSHHIYCIYENCESIHLPSFMKLWLDLRQIALAEATEVQARSSPRSKQWQGAERRGTGPDGDLMIYVLTASWT